MSFEFIFYFLCDQLHYYYDTFVPPQADSCTATELLADSRELRVFKLDAHSSKLVAEF
jgi:hypothetical protein